MSYFNSVDPQSGDKQAADLVETIIVPRTSDLGGFQIRRALPSPKKQMVGPFIFFDHIGPAEFLTDQGIDVRPHPHIGLETVTYLFEGEIWHRDSLGTSLPIKPGEVNWMTAGSGIVHSERTSEEKKATGSKLFGIQSWVALPSEKEEMGADFSHHSGSDLPVVEANGAHIRLIAGSLYGKTAGVKTQSPLFYADVSLKSDSKIPLDSEYEERGLYILEGEVEIAGDKFGPGQLLVFKPGDKITLNATGNCRFILLGGEPMDSPRYIWWNFVSSSKERIEQAKNEWRENKFDIVPGDESEFIPLPK